MSKPYKYPYDPFEYFQPRELFKCIHEEDWWRLLFELPSCLIGWQGALLATENLCFGTHDIHQEKISNQRIKRRRWLRHMGELLIKSKEEDDLDIWESY